MIQYKTVLALGPHPDDVEIGCGGTLAMLVQNGASVHIRAFSPCTDSLPVGYVSEDIRREAVLAAEVLGVRSASVLNFPVRRFNAHRQQILEAFIQLRRVFKPDLVLVPGAGDMHQDHQVLHQEVLRAFRMSTILGYEVPWSNRALPITAYVPLTREHLATKMSALRCYESQEGRQYISEKNVEALATVRGSQVGVERAEAFEVISALLQGL